MNWRDRWDLVDLFSAFGSLGVTDPMRDGLETDFFSCYFECTFFIVRGVLPHQFFWSQGLRFKLFL